MSEFSQQDLTRVKNFHYTPEYHLVERIINDLISEAQRRSPISETEWETVKNALLGEGEQRGLARLMQRLSELASKSP